MPFFIIFLSIPLIEIALFIIIGSAIGVGPTLLLCVISAVIGSFIIQNQGTSSFDATRKSLDSGTMPLPSIFDTLCLALAGVLLIAPGFFTDALAFALLVPALRARLRRKIGKHFGIDASAPQADIIAGEYEVVTDPAPRLSEPPDLKP